MEICVLFGDIEGDTIESNSTIPGQRENPQIIQTSEINNGPGSSSTNRSPEFASKQRAYPA